MSLSLGTKLGPYEIVSALGAGGMGEVYRAHDPRLDRTVAIKVLPSHLSSDPDLKQRFEREARMISKFSHPHICTLYDIGSQDAAKEAGLRRGAGAVRRFRRRTLQRGRRGGVEEWQS